MSCLLPGSYKQIRKKNCPFSAARSVVAKSLHQPVVPSLADWACDIDRIEHIERMVAWDGDKSKSHTIMWTVWLHFWFSSDFDTFVSDMQEYSY